MKDTLLFIPVKLDDTRVIKRLLDSLKHSGYFRNSSFGVVVVDDRCPNSKVKKLCSEYPVTYLRTKGVGKMAALNYAVRRTSSKYVAFTDQDNIVVSANWLQTLKSNFTSKDIGYVSGRVTLFQAESEVQKRWEKKGALNKGNEKLVFGKEFFEKFRLRGVPINLCTAGSNHIMPRKVLEEIGFHDERFGPGAFVDGAGGDLDITYRVLKRGYTVIYDPKAVIGHEHPTTFPSLRNKMFSYGISDTAIHLKFLFEFGDIRSFFQVFYRIGQNTSRFLRSFTGSYPLPPHVALASILGNLVGPIKYLELRLKKSH
ncbi:glycosyltransferase [Patescibacteria group bacterium]|nr:glycosyltransferase [Patescibacteria group bacterium]